MLKTVEERLKSYEPLWENWTYTGNFLGEGAMSSVFEIRSDSMGLNEVAALKIITINKDFRGEVKIPENALNEIKIMQTLSGSAHIVNYHDNAQRKVLDENGELCAIDILIKMEKLTSLNERDKLSEEQVIRLAKDMCSALIHSSSHNIIHRDIKPQNIFVDADGSYKLGDFGVAKMVSRLSSSYTMNIGTLAYAAPEATNATGGAYDISSDIYSLGLVLYVFLNNGYLPFTNSTTINEAISKRLAGAPFPSPENGSKTLKALVMRACNFDRIKRFQTPQEMYDALESLSSDGKKLVVDPFATLDANENLSEMASHLVKTPDSSSSKKEVRAAKEPAPKTAETDLGDSATATESPIPPHSSTGGGLRINMKTSSRAPEITSSGHTPSTETSVSPSGSGLRINMKSSSKSSESTTSGYPTPAKTPVSPLSSGGGLRINMKTSSKPADIPAAGTSEKPEVSLPNPEPTPASDEKKKDSFFSVPDSL